MRQDKNPRRFNPQQRNNFNNFNCAQLAQMMENYQLDESLSNRSISDIINEQAEAQQMLQESWYLEKVYLQNLPPQSPSLKWKLWKRNDYYQRHGDVFIKQKVNFMKYVHTQNPLPSQGTFVFQLRVIVPGTISFGIATGDLIRKTINQQTQFIDSRQPESLFFSSFSNGSGLINVHGEVEHNGKNIHVAVGNCVYMTLHMNRRVIIFEKKGLHVRYKFSDYFGSKEIFPFFQIKNISTAVEVRERQNSQFDF